MDRLGHALALGRRLFGLQLVAHPSRLPRDVAAAASRAIAANRLVFHPGVARAIVAYRATPFDPALPVTIAWGDRDRITPPAQARRAAQVMPAARHVTLTGCGHVPTFDDPEQVACAVLGARAA
jgi:pimeloyl-ACP methyl ester carboxylesterase